MREYERLNAEGKVGSNPKSPPKRVEHNAVNIKDDVTTSSAGDVGSESSVSDVQVQKQRELIFLHFHVLQIAVREPTL